LYLEKWSNTFLPLKAFCWTVLKNPLVWEEIQHGIKYINDADQNIIKISDKEERFNKFSYITNISKNKMSDWNTHLIITVEILSEVFEFMQSEGISFRNIHTILEFSLAIPGTSASIKRVFSIANAVWTDKKNSFLIETIKEVIITKTHFQDLSRNDFYTLILKKPKLLQEICLSQKYETSAQQEEPTTSISDRN
jgi:hypothetical protein